ncbi:hypothetical protein PSTT_14109 [Puccinia striiformis]|uniref:Uncharacterized protein n=1 Tax=Puccinia striiformis TaxID=27350 RepID=A0A2S4UNL7_9BASI|nr:hypothetical protein PSTT_14109 [Puccinia striiformis]
MGYLRVDCTLKFDESRRPLHLYFHLNLATLAEQRDQRAEFMGTTDWPFKLTLGGSTYTMISRGYWNGLHYWSFVKIPSITTMDEEDYYDPRADLDRLPVGKIDFPSFTTPYQHESYPAFNGGPNLSAEQLEIFAAWRQLAITGKLLQELAR